jgi:hypothetical protein
MNRGIDLFNIQNISSYSTQSQYKLMIYSQTVAVCSKELRKQTNAKCAKIRRVITGFRREVDEICALLGRYVPHSGNPLTAFRTQPIGHIFKVQ